MVTWGIVSGLHGARHRARRASSSCASCSASPRPGSSRVCCCTSPTGSRRRIARAWSRRCFSPCPARTPPRPPSRVCSCRWTAYGACRLAVDVPPRVVPAVLLAPVVLIVLTDRPADATWLEAGRAGLARARMAAERRAIEGGRPSVTLLQVLTDRRVLVALAHLPDDRHRDLRHHVLPAADRQDARVVERRTPAS